MHTLGTYQTGAVRNAEDLDTDRLALNLMIALGEMARLTVAAEESRTRPFDNQETYNFTRQILGESAGPALAD